MSAAELNPELRNLIDERLDAIDRALASARVSWSERRSIVGEVDTQIFELLFRRNASPTRDDVIHVLASLDPAESYIPEELRNAARAEPPQASPSLLQKLSVHSKKLLEFVSAALALALVNGLIVMLMVQSNGVIPWLIALVVLARLNVSVVRYVRSRPGSLLDEVRQAVGAWILPKNGVQRV
jgi:hypothetical protein